MEHDMQRRWTAAMLTAALAAIITVGLAAPAQATPPPYGPDTEYVALGDSYSSGLGASGSTADCGRSPNGYPSLWAQARAITDFVDVSCSGAQTGDVLATQLSALSADTDVVTITIGGNDAVLGNLATTCLQGNTQCANVNSQFAVDMPSFVAQVAAGYGAIRQAAPNADVYVLGYPRIFETGSFCYGLFVPNQYQRTLLAQSLNAFNDALAVAAADAGLRWVDVRTAFTGHGVCSLTPWLHTTFSLPAPLHPNDDGHRYGYLAALTAVTG
jgi:lysophospholipase L1-like esterase